MESSSRPASMLTSPTTANIATSLFSRSDGQLWCDPRVRSNPRSQSQDPRRSQAGAVLPEVVLQSPAPPASALEVRLPPDQVGRRGQGAYVGVKDERRHKRQNAL